MANKYRVLSNPRDRSFANVFPKARSLDSTMRSNRTIQGTKYRPATSSQRRSLQAPQGSRRMTGFKGPGGKFR